jgi:hypothetical protein
MKMKEMLAEVQLNVSKLKKVKLTKVSDDKFFGNHPNRINEGFTITGVMFQSPIVGQSCVVNSIMTSVVTEVIDENNFKTMNSTYKIEYL